jgi:lipoprotein-releasing system permease protein
VSLERFIAHRIVFYKPDRQQISRPVVRIATAGIALGFAIMVLAVAIVGGFKKEIRDKLIGFNAHLQISHFDQNFSYESSPILDQPDLRKTLSGIKEIEHIQSYVTKAGILKSNGQLQGVVAKGINSDYDWSFFSKNLKSGSVFKPSETKKSDEILLSTSLAKKLDVKCGDSLIMYFIQKPPRARKFKIAGIFETGFEEFDNLYLFCDIHQLQKLNDWKSDEISGLEIRIKDFDQLESATENIYNAIGADLNARSIKDNFPQIFDWLSLQDINAVIIITLMIIVSGINMIAALLVIMLERIRMIGTLKALGAENTSIRNTFLWVATYIIGRGMLIGNLVGIGLVVMQHYFHVIPLDESSYYISFVPTEIVPLKLLLLNAGTLLLCVAMMLIPAWWIGRIRPSVSVRFN